MKRLINNMIVKAVLVVLFILSLTFILTNIDLARVQPFQTKVDIEYEISKSNSGKCGCAVAYSSQDVIFLDENDEVIRWRPNSYMLSTNILNVKCLAYDDSIFVQRYSQDNFGSYLSNEEIIEYDKFGNYKRQIFSIDYDRADNRANDFQITDFAYDGENFYISRTDFINKKVILYIALDNSQNEALSTREYCLTSFPTEYNIVYSKYNCKSDYWYLEDSNNSFFKTKVFSNHNEYIYERISKDAFINSTEDGNNANYSLYPHQASYNLQWAYMVISIIFWLAVIYCILFILVVFVKYCLYLFRKKHKTTLKLFLLSLSAIILCLFIVFFYSDNIEKIHLQDIEREQSVTNSQIVLTMHDKFDNVFQKYQNFGKIENEEIDYFSDIFEKISLTSASKGIACNIFMSVYYNNQFHVVACSTKNLDNDIYYMETIQKLFDSVTPEQPTCTYNYDVLFNTYRYSSTAIYDSDNNIEGVVTSSYNYPALINLIFRENVFLFMQLLLIFIILIFVGFTINNINTNIHNRRELSNSNKIFKNEFLFIDIMIFVIYMAKRADSALIIIITKELIDAVYSNVDPLLYTLPITCITAGSIFAPILYPFLKNRINIRKVLIISSIVSLVFYILCVYAVINKDILLLCLSLLFANTGLTVVETYSNNVVMSVKDQHVRDKLNEQVTYGSICGTIVAPLIATGIIQLFGNASIYIMASFFVLLTIIVICLAVPLKSCVQQDSEKNKKKSRDSLKPIFKEIRKFYKKPVVLGVVFFSFAAILLLNCNKSILFPLLADNYGLGKTEISLITTIAVAVPILFSNYYSLLAKKLNNMNILLICIFIGAILFVLNNLSLHFVWIAINMIIISTIYIFAYNSSNASCYDVINKLEAPKGETLSSILVIHGIMAVLVSPVFGIMLDEGFYLACVICCIVILSLGFIYYITMSDYKYNFKDLIYKVFANDHTRKTK